MPIDCPVTDCTYTTPEEASDPALIVQLLKMHDTSAHTSSTSAKVEKVKRPSISQGGTNEEWIYFVSRWNDYVAATKITGHEKVVQLLECCDEGLRKDLTRSAGGNLTQQTVDDLLINMKKLAVRQENIMVSRFTLHNMQQDHEEPVRAFGARIKGQALTCEFSLKCGGCQETVNYTDEVLRDVLSRGIADTEIQLDLLGDQKQDMSLEEMFKFVEAKESGKRSATRLIQTHNTSAARNSTYTQGKKEIWKPQTGNESEHMLCSYCGKRGHGHKSSILIRKKSCPAYGKFCKKCSKPNHFDSLCRSGHESMTQAQALTNESGAIFSGFCSITTSDEAVSAIRNTKQINSKLGHHMYDQRTEGWRRSISDPQPFLQLTVTAERADYISLGIPAPMKFHPVVVSAMADTGCQSCLIGVKVIIKMGIKLSELANVSMMMHTANNNSINILGAAPLRFSGTNSTGQRVETRQMVYVTDETEKVFLSKDACKALGMISSCFPSIGEVSSAFEINNEEQVAIEESTCTCPKRQLPPPRPTILPFPAMDENREKIEQWILEYYSKSTFNTCPHRPLTMMEGPPLRLAVDPDAIPSVCHKAIPVPIHWREKVKKGLDQDVALGVIELVPVGEPVTWCHRMVVCAKKSGEPRRTVDLQALNRWATRETHHTQSPFHQARSVPSGMKKTVLDAWNGYHSVPLHDSDRHLTTFITPWGRYRYRVAPQGYLASGDGYARRYDQIVADSQISYDAFTKCIDDTLIWGSTIEENFHRTIEWLDMCGRHGITLNPSKFEYAKDEVQFAGFEITQQCVRPSSKYLQSIKDFPTPRNLTDIRAWFGVVNQVSYAFSMTDKMHPFRELLKASTEFHWDDALNDIFEQSKLKIISEIEKGVQIFDKGRPTCLATDWSKQGIGFWLFQKHCSCAGTELFCCNNGWKTTLVGSRFTHPAESRYAPIEGEALAIAEALDKSRFFVLGCDDLTVVVDHKPLLRIFNDRSLEEIPNARLRNLKEKTLRYRFKITHIPGVKNKTADFASRYPAGPQEVKKLHLVDDEDDISSVAVSNIPRMQKLFLERIRQKEETTWDFDSNIMRNSVSSLGCTSVTWEKVHIATNNDKSLQLLLAMIEEGLPEAITEMPTETQEYYPFRHGLCTIEGVILYKERVVIPLALRESVLDSLHAAHHGITAMQARAECSVFWPGITVDIKRIRDRCVDCDVMAPSQPNIPPTPPMTPEYPFQCVCADYFQYRGINYLVVVDRYSNWPIVERATNGSRGLISTLRGIFATFGIPDELSSDGGPEFTASATKNFLRDWGIHHRLSSVAFPHSNCRAEVGVKTVKRMISSNTGPCGELDVDLFQRAILQYRNAPDATTKLSPAQCLFGRPIKDFIPILPGKYRPHPTWMETLQSREEALRNRHMQAAERWAEHTRLLSPLRVGDKVRMQNQTGNRPTKWDRTGIIVEVRQFHQYVVKVDGSGRVTIRNRKFLRKYEPFQARKPVRSIDDENKLLKRIVDHQAMNRYIPPSLSGDAPVRSSTKTTENSRIETPVSSIQPDFDPPLDVGMSSSPEPNLQMSEPEDITQQRRTKIPRALKELLPYNAPGLQEFFKPSSRTHSNQDL